MTKPCTTANKLCIEARPSGNNVANGKWYAIKVRGLCGRATNSATILRLSPVSPPPAGPDKKGEHPYRSASLTLRTAVSVSCFAATELYC